MKPILVTGANGFVGKNLILELKNRGYGEIFAYDVDSTMEQLDMFCASCGFVFHLAGVNRPKEEAEFMEGNFGFTSTLLNTLKKHGNQAPVLITSSIQAALDNPYGRSKKAGEDLLFQYGAHTGVKVFVYRLPNVFGKWCRPNYNSVVATFCHNIARGLPITIHDPNVDMQLVYIDDVVDALIRAMEGDACMEGDYCCVPVVHGAKLGEIAARIEGFYESRKTLRVPDLSDDFTRKLYATYLSYLPEDAFSYGLTTHKDQRGSFAEVLKMQGFGQVSVNISKPHIVKGNHWHHTKNEKFLVVSGHGVIRFRKPGGTEVLEYAVSADRLMVVDIPVGYTHNIENLGDCDMVTLMWASEEFDPEKADTYYLEV